MARESQRCSQELFHSLITASFCFLWCPPSCLGTLTAVNLPSSSWLYIRCSFGIPYVWLRDVLTRLPSWSNSRINELLPYAENRFS
nr:transposase domain-containing protein [Edaphovirga cremea]